MKPNEDLSPGESLTARCCIGFLGEDQLLLQQVFRIQLHLFRGEGLNVAPEIPTGMAEAVAKGEGFDFVPANDWHDFLYQNWLLEHMWKNLMVQTPRVKPVPEILKPAPMAKTYNVSPFPSKTCPSLGSGTNTEF